MKVKSWINRGDSERHDKDSMAKRNIPVATVLIMMAAWSPLEIASCIH